MKVNVFHVEGALPYVLSAHETTTIRFPLKRVWSLQAQIQREKNLNFFMLSIWICVIWGLASMRKKRIVNRATGNLSLIR